MKNKQSKKIAKRKTLKSPEYKKPEDLLYASVSTIISPVPYASSLFESLLASPLEVRRREWEQEITLIVNTLQHDHGLSVKDLATNQEFISVVLHATTIALKNHQKEKIKALSNAVVNSALSNRAKTLENLDLIFVRYIDELTPLHMQLLALYVDHPDLLRSCRSYNDLYSGIQNSFQSTLDRDEFLLVNNELSGKALIRISADLESFEDIYHVDSLALESTNDTLPRIIVSEIGQRFISFVTLPRK